MNFQSNIKKYNQFFIKSKIQNNQEEAKDTESRKNTTRNLKSMII